MASSSRAGAPRFDSAELGELAHLALLHGEPRYLSAEELETFSADERFPARGWEYYVSRLKNRG